METGFDIKQAKKLLNVGQLTKDECQKCWCQKYVHNVLRERMIMENYLEIGVWKIAAMQKQVQKNDKGLYCIEEK